MILIKDGRVVDPGNQKDEQMDLLIENGMIIQTGTDIVCDPDTEIIDAAGLVVAPGLVDVHVHFRDPGLIYKEDIHTGAAAAAKGGYTTVVCMANTKPAIDNEETVRYVLEEGKKTPVNVLTCAAISKGLKGSELTDMEALKECGAAGFTDDGIPLLGEKLVMKAMQEAKRLDVPLSFHEEDPAFITNNGINRGAVSEELGIGGSPALAEDVLVARDCMLALHAGARVNIQHMSSKNALEAIRMAKRLGALVTAEVTPHHFTLDESAVLKHGTLAKMNPPLRTAQDRAAIIQAIQDGTIDLIATDHAPHSVEEKAKPLTEAPSGIIGLETALALGISSLVRPGYITLLRLMEMMSLNPSRLYKLDHGSISVGKKADLVIFDEKEEWTVDSFVSKASNSPFVGEKLCGRVKYTICNGKIAYQDK